jgi:hypothetical protein
MRWVITARQSWHMLKNIELVTVLLALCVGRIGARYRWV